MRLAQLRPRRLAVAAVLEEARVVRAREVGLAGAPITIRMSGCPNGCSRPFLAEIGLVGKAPGKYNLYLGGTLRGERLNALHRESIGEQQILDTLRPLLAAYASERSVEECFGDFLVRTGVVPAMLEGRQFQLVAPLAAAGSGRS